MNLHMMIELGKNGQNAILSIPLTLTAELGKPETSLGKLMKSTEGEVFPMATPEHIVVKIAGEYIPCRYW